MIAIAYKRDYSTSCRGCTMERYSSDFLLHHFVTDEEAIEWFAKLDGTTRFEQDDGKDAWEFQIIKDGFEAAMQIAQCHDPEIDGAWTSQGEATSFFGLEPEMSAKVKARADEIYLQAKEAAAFAYQQEQKKRQAEQHAREVARAKQLLASNPQDFKD